MAERVVRYKAVADFLSLARDVRRSREEIKDLKEEEVEANEASAKSSAKADAADAKRTRTRRDATAATTEYTKATTQSTRADEQATRATRSRDTEQNRYAKSLKDVVRSVKDYANNVQKMIDIEQRAGGSKRELANAQESQAKASKVAQTAAERLTRAEERLAATQREAAKEATLASQARVKAANSVERATISLAAAEEKLNAVPSDRPDLMRKAELALSDARLVSERAAGRLEQAEKRLTAARSGRDNNRIRKAERDVAVAMQASVAAAGQLESASKRVDNVMSTLSSAGSGLGGVLGTLQRGLGGFAESMTKSLPTMAAFAAAIPVIISLIGTLVGGLAALAGGAFALVSALGPLIGVLGTLPNFIGGAVFAIGTLAAAFMGVGEAVKESLAVQKNAAKVAKDSAKAQKQAARQVADAIKALRNAKENQARGEIAANRAVRDATRALADARAAAVEGQEQAARSLVSAERSVRDAQESSRRAQENLTQARKDAIRNILDLKEATEDTARSEKRASLSLEEARLRLQQVLNDPGATSLEKRDAALAVEEAQDALSDVQKQAAETRKEYQKAQKDGVEKSEAVVDAKRAERDSLENLADAQYNLIQATKAVSKQQVDSQRAIAQAQEGLNDAIQDRSRQERDAMEAVQAASQNLADAYDAQKEAALTTYNATEKLRQAMAELGPEGKKFVELLLRLKPVLDDIRKAAQKGLFPGLGQALETFAELAPIITPAVEKMGRAIGDAAKKVADVTKSPIFRGQLSRILESSAKIMGHVGTIVANLVQVFFNLADASRPFTEWLAETAEGWTEQWKAMTSGSKNQKKLTDFFTEAKDTLKIVSSLIWDFTKAIFGIGKASQSVGKDFLKNLADSAEKFSAFVNSTEGQARIKKWFEDIAPTVKDIAGAAKDLVIGILQLADDPGVAAFFKDLREKFVPAVVELVEATGTEPAQGFLDVLTIFTNWGADTTAEFAKFVDNVAYFLKLLTGIGDESDDASLSVGEFLKGFFEPTGLILLNKGLGLLRGLIEYFKGNDDKGGGGGSWGDEGPLGKFGEKIDWLKDKLQDFLDWLRKNWPTILSLIVNPFSLAIGWITSHWAQFQVWLIGKFLDILGWLRKNWPQLAPIILGPLGIAITEARKHGDTLETTFQNIWDTIKRGAERFTDSMDKTISKLKEVFSDPVGFVINTVLNGALIDGFNGLISKVTGSSKLNIPHIKPPPFATGGVYPGYTPGRDIGYIGVSGGEAIMRPEWTRAVGKGEVDNMNAAARRGGKKGVLRYLGGFANGGQVGGGNSDFAPTSFRGKRMNYRTIKMLLAAEKLYGGQFSITQGSYSTSVKASGTTHAGGGVLDLGWTGSNAQITALRRVGFAAWHRTPGQGPWNHHVHIVALGDPTESDSAKRQVASYLAGGNGLGGKDDGPRVSIDPNLIAQLGITDEDVRRAAEGGGGSFLDTLASWVKAAISNPVGFLKDKVAGPVKEMFAKFGNGVLTQTLAKIPELAFSSMASLIKTQVGNFLDNLIPGNNGGATESSLRSMVQARAAAYGWDKGGNWDALQWIISKESSWNPNAKNPNSSAYGLFQFLDGTWGAVGMDKTSDPGRQTDAGLKYIRQRYGTPEAARAFHQNNGWYKDGGVVDSGSVQTFARGGAVFGVGNRDTVPAMLTPGEFVLRKDVVKSIGMRRLHALNNKKTRNLKPTDSGIQHFHAGGPVLGIRKGMTGNTVRALRYLLNLPSGAAPVYGQWDAGLDKILRQPGAYKKLSNSWKLGNRDRRYALLANYLASGTTTKSYAQAVRHLGVNDATMIKVWEGTAATIKKRLPRNRWNLFESGYIKKRVELTGYVAQLNKALGLGPLNGNVWKTNSQMAMKHVLEHVYGIPHDALEYRPWLGGFTPVEIAAQNAKAANKKTNEFNGFLETLSTWGLTDLVKDLLEKGVEDGYTIAQSAVGNRAVATILNNEIKNAKLLTAEDQVNLLTMISTLAGSIAQLGLRDLARALGLSDLDTVTLFEKANQLGRLSKVPASKLTKLRTDISMFRAGTFYAAGGGEVPGSGSGDTVPAMLTPGEFVLRKAAVQALGLDAAYWLNENPQKFAQGGLVNQFSLAGLPKVNIPRVGAGLRSGSSGVLSAPGTGTTVMWDVDIINPVAETSTKSLTKVLQRQSVLGPAGAKTE